MAALNRSCSEPDAFAGGTSAGATLPFLPTLVVAACVALGTLCWESAAPPGPVPAISSESPAGPLPRMVHVSATASGFAEPDLAEAASAPREPAIVAFARQFPLMPGSRPDAFARAEPRPAASLVRLVRAVPPASGCSGQRCREAPAQTASAPLRRPHPGVGTASVPSAAQPFAAASAEPDTAETALPEQALPFAPTLAPTVRAIRQTVGFVGSQARAIGSEASVIGGAVVDLVGGLR